MITQEMLQTVINKADRYVPAFTLKDSEVYVFRIADGCMRYARKPIVNDAAVNNMQSDTFCINTDTDNGKIEIEFISAIHDDEFEITIFADVEFLQPAAV